MSIYSNLNMPKDAQELNPESQQLDNRWDIMDVENDVDDVGDTGIEDQTFTDLPNALIVTNVAVSVFDNEESKVGQTVIIYLCLTVEIFCVCV